MTKEQNDYINYRLQRATDTLNDARLLAENDDGIPQLTECTTLVFMPSLPYSIIIRSTPRLIKEYGLNS